MRQKWIDFSAEKGIIQLIEEKNDTYMYVTKSREYDGRSSMYHVWKGNRHIFCNANYREAVNCFERNSN